MTTGAAPHLQDANVSTHTPQTLGGVVGLLHQLGLHTPPTRLPVEILQRPRAALRRLLFIQAGPLLLKKDQLEKPRQSPDLPTQSEITIEVGVTTVSGSDHLRGAETVLRPDRVETENLHLLLDRHPRPPTAMATATSSRLPQPDRRLAVFLPLPCHRQPAHRILHRKHQPSLEDTILF